MRPLHRALLAAACLLAAGCNDHSLSLDLQPNPLVIGLMDTQATVHAHVVAKGFGKVPISSVQFAAFSSSDAQLASQTESVDQNMPASPFGFVVNRDFTIPINGALVALSGAKYVMVKVLDPQGGLLAEKRLDIVVHALKDLRLPDALNPAAPAAPSPTPAPSR
jgi:hypothetical protein